MESLDFGRKIYESVERIVVLKNTDGVIDFDCHVSPMRVAATYGKIGTNFCTLIHNFGDNSFSEKYVQILSDNGRFNYTIYKNGRSDRKLPSDLLTNLEKFVYCN
jgi:hypothetical protein